MLFPTLRDDVIEYFRRRSSRYFVVIFLLGLTLIGRLAWLQIIKYDYYRLLSENNRIRIVKVKADRGFIKDRDGEILVRNAPSYEVFIVKEDAGSIPELLGRLSNVIDFNVASARKKIKKSYYYEPTVIARGLSYRQVAYLAEHSSSFPGVEIGLEAVRSYNDGTSVSHIIGYMGEVTENDLDRDESYALGELIGKTGVEATYEHVLRGVDGARQVEVDSFGRTLEVLDSKEPVPGKNLLLTVDHDLQSFARRILDESTGSIVVLDTKTNSVISLYSAPYYDLNLFTPFITPDAWRSLSSDPEKPLINRAIEGMYPPGSVFKILMSVAGLEEEVITDTSTYTCNGWLRYGRFTYHCWKRSGHGKVDINRAIAESCDVFFYNLGLNTGIDTIVKYARGLSLGSPTGIDLPNEKSGFFPDRDWKLRTQKSEWYPGETVITSIGQGYTTTTPIQIAVMTAGIFNGGRIYEPRVVGAFEDPITGAVTPVEPVLKRQVIIDPEVSEEVLLGMLGAVYAPHGTSRRARTSGVIIGGKTGTAQVVSLKQTEEYENDEDIPVALRDHSWFTSIFPAYDPRYVVTVMVEHGGSGSKSAASVAGAVINRMVGLGYVEAE